jgi:hypothetical protein
MKKAMMSLSIIGLVVLLALPSMHIAGVVSAELSKWGITVGTVLWFSTAHFWMRARLTEA